MVHVVPPRRRLVGLWKLDLRTVSAVHRHAGAALKRLAETLDPSRQLDLSTGVVSGAASVEFVRAARGFDADLLVIGARGEHEVRTTDLTLGGTAIKLLGTAPVPLLLVRKVAQLPRPVIAAVDLSPLSERVLTWARASVAEDEVLTVFHAYEVPFASRLDAYGIARETIDLYGNEELNERKGALEVLLGAASGTRNERVVVRRGDAIEGLFECIRELEPGLIVVGKHARRRPRPVNSSGSMTRHVAFFAPANVLIVPPAREAR
jgi:nucleotide-binding universal stress UspA family protein